MERRAIIVRSFAEACAVTPTKIARVPMGSTVARKIRNSLTNFSIQLARPGSNVPTPAAMNSIAIEAMMRPMIRVMIFIPVI